MTAFVVVIVTCGACALTALALSMTRRRLAARRLAQVSLWLVVAGVPVALAGELTSGRVELAQALSHVGGYGAALLPCAAIAGMGLRRASSR